MTVCTKHAPNSRAFPAILFAGEMLFLPTGLNSFSDEGTEGPCSEQQYFININHVHQLSMIDT